MKKLNINKSLEFLLKKAAYSKWMREFRQIRLPQDTEKFERYYQSMIEYEKLIETKEDC